MQADQISVGDLNGDNSCDLLGLWSAYPGTWVRYSNGMWVQLGSTCDYLDNGKMR